MDSIKLKEIQSILKQKGSEEVKASFRKFVPTSQKVYGVRLPEINHLVNQYKKEGIDLVVALWKAGGFEERLLAAKLLGKLAKNRSIHLNLFSNFLRMFQIRLYVIH